MRMLRIRCERNIRKWGNEGKTSSRGYMGYFLFHIHLGASTSTFGVRLWSRVSSVWVWIWSMVNRGPFRILDLHNLFKSDGG